MHNNFLRMFCFNNFPFLEKDFDALTDYEMISKIFEYFDKKIKEVDEKYAGFGDEVESLRIQFEELQTNINSILSDFQENLTTEINDSVDLKLANQYNKIVLLLSNYQTVVDNTIENLRSDLEQEIQEIELGNIYTYNPTNGLFEPLSKVINDVYDSSRFDAISALEFDDLELTCTEFQSYNITASNFDYNAKVILV